MRVTNEKLSQCPHSQNSKKHNWKQLETWKQVRVEDTRSFSGQKGDKSS